MEALEDELADDYMKKVEEASRNIDGMDGGDVTLELWKLKKQVCPQNRETPVAMLGEEENLVTNENQIKQLAINAYKERLRNRPIREGLENIKESKEKLADSLMYKAKQNKTLPWDMTDLEAVLNKLKKNKSRDPNGLANELFKTDSAGDDLKVEILKLMNRITNEQIYP